MKSKHIGTAVLLAGGLLMQLAMAQADLKYTKEMRMGDDPKTPPMQVVTTAIRQNARREETRQSYGPVQMNSVTLTLCEKRESIKLDPKLKIYTVSALDENGIPVADTSNAGKNDGGPVGTGKIIMTTNVKDLGEETVAGFKARHYMITSRMQNSGCIGDADINLKMELWTTDIREPMACETGNADPSRAYAQMKSNCKITFEQKGDKDAYTKAYGGMILRMKMYDSNTGKTTMIQDTTALSQAKIEEDALFTVPADYKKVSEKEFQQAQTKAMMDAMTGGAAGKGGGRANNTPDDDGDGNANNGNANNGNEGNGDANGQEAKDEDAPAAEPKEKPKKEEKKKQPKIKIPGLPF